jgi:ribosomal protein L24
MFVIDEHVQITFGEDKGKRGRIQGVSPDKTFYDVFLIEEKVVKQFSKDELESLED